MREQRDVAVDRARPGYHPVHARTHLFRRLAARASIPEDQPARRHLVDLLGRQSLVLAVVPLDQVGVDDGLVAQARQFAGLSRPLHRAAENKRKCVGGEYRPHPLRKPATVVGQRNVRRTGVLATEAPRRLPVPDREHVHVRLPPAGSDVIGLCRTNPRRSRLLPPPPAGDLGHIVAVPGDELLVVDELVADRLLGVGGPRPELRHAVDHVAHQVEAIEIVQHAHVERRRGGALFLVAAHMDVVVARAPVGQPVNEPRVAMEGEDDRLVGREQRVEIVIRETVRVLARGLQLHQIDDIDDADLQIGACLRRRSTAASVSSVGTSPQHAITTSGSPPRSLLAHSQMPSPASQCLTASSIVSH